MATRQCGLAIGAAGSIIVVFFFYVRAGSLEGGAVDDLDIDGELAALVGQDEDTDAAAASVEGTRDLLPQTRLVQDREAGLNLTGLRHASQGTVGDVEHTVLLQDGTQHSLDNDAGRGVGDEGGLLVELLGEQVNTKVAVLAGGSRGRDADDLARAALEDQDITIADVVARDGHGVGDAGRAAAGGCGSRHLTNDLGLVMVVVVVVGENFICHFV